MLWHISIATLVAVCHAKDIEVGQDKFGVFRGAITSIGRGHVILEAKMDEDFTLDQAFEKCASLPDCQGFSVQEGKETVVFSNKWDLDRHASGWMSYRKRTRPDHPDHTGFFAIGSFTKGALMSGSDIFTQTMTLPAAVKKCQSLPDCKGFTVNEPEQPPLDKKVTVYFKKKWQLSEAEGWISYQNKMAKPNTARTTWHQRSRSPGKVTHVGGTSHQKWYVEPQPAPPSSGPTKQKDHKPLADMFRPHGLALAKNSISDIAKDSISVVALDSISMVATPAKKIAAFLGRAEKPEEGVMWWLPILGIGGVILLVLAFVRLVRKMGLMKAKMEDDWHTRVSRNEMVKEAMAIVMADGKAAMAIAMASMPDGMATAPKEDCELTSAVTEQSDQVELHGSISQRSAMSQVIDQAYDDKGL